MTRSQTESGWFIFSSTLWRSLFFHCSQDLEFLRERRRSPAAFDFRTPAPRHAFIPSLSPPPRFVKHTVLSHFFAPHHTAQRMSASNASLGVVSGGETKSTLRLWGESFPLDIRSKVAAGLFLLTAIGYFVSWVSAACLLAVVVIPLLELMNKNRRARNAVQSADRVIRGALTAGSRLSKKAAARVAVPVDPSPPR